MPYSRVLRRRTRSPYLDIIQAQGPAARSAKYLEEERALTEEGQEIQRGGLQLQRESLEQQGLEARDRLALEREGMELGASQAKKAQDIQVAQTGLLGAYAGHKVYKGLTEPEPKEEAINLAPDASGVYSVHPETGLAPYPGEIEPTTGMSRMKWQTEPSGAVAPASAATATTGGVTPALLPYSVQGAPATGSAAAAEGATGMSHMNWGGGGGAGAGWWGGQTTAGKTGTVVGIAGQGYGLYRDMDRPSSSYEKGSKSKYGRGMGRTAGTAVGAYFGGGLGATVGGELGARFGEKTWPGIVTGMEAGDEIVEDLARLKIHSAGERTGDAIAGMNMGDPVTETLSRGVGDVIEEGSRVLDDIIPSCIIYTYFYGPHSREKRYARIFCARHMTKERYLGYIAAGTKVIDLAKNLFRNDVEKHLWLKNKLKNAMPEPYFRYMMYKLKGGKLSIRDRIAAAILNKWFDWEAERLGDNIVINNNPRGCYFNAGRRIL